MVAQKSLGVEGEVGSVTSQSMLPHIHIQNGTDQAMDRQIGIEGGKLSAVYAPLKKTTILSLVRGGETAEDIADLLAISLEG